MCGCKAFGEDCSTNASCCSGACTASKCTCHEAGDVCTGSQCCVGLTCGSKHVVGGVLIGVCQ
jgi:hypothetical protein